MRKLIVISMISLDGILQAPGGPDEDPSGGFEFGGWVAPFENGEDNKMKNEQMQPADLLLGRTTFEIWENYWPLHADLWPGINEVNKYVLSTTRISSEWNASVFLKNIDEIKNLKASEGSDIKVWGSGKLIQSLFKNDLVDELWLNIYPLTLGKGKKLFDEGPIPAAFQLIKSTVTSSGVIMAAYKRSGEVETGNLGG